MSNPLLAYIRGIKDIPTVVEINIRSGPNTAYDLVFKARVGVADLPVLDVRPDDKGANLQGKIYQWFLLKFPDGKTGWARDDLIEISGDGTTFGYSLLTTRAHAFALTRRVVAPVNSVPPVAPPVTVPAAPAVPTPPAAPAAPAVPPPAAAPTPSIPGAPPVVIVKTQGAANTRFGPGTNFNRTGVTLPRHNRYPLLEVQRETIGQNYRWFKINNNGQQHWIREDLVTYEGDTTRLGLPADLYPAPMQDKYWWVRGYNMPPNLDAGLPQHDGWDLGAANAEPVYAGPNGGLVVKSFECPKCTLEKPSTLLNGFRLGDPTIFSDTGWGNGYGSYIIVRYTNEQLPASTRDLLTSKGFAGGAIFVMYAHLHTRAVENNQVLAPGQQIGTCGNTGNSEAPHVHLEIRIARDAQFIGWANIRSGVTDPVALFKR